jgi:serine/threonine-protein kinase PknG
VVRVHLQLRHPDSSQARLQHSPTMAKFYGRHEKRGLMTACMQPGCTGTIVDCYCDACGSPAGAVPFVPAQAAASAGSPAPADEGLTAVPRGSELPLEPKSGGLDTACTQPGCTGTIVDGYCDGCGGPAGAAPFIPAAASAASPAPADQPGLTAGPSSTPAADAA